MATAASHQESLERVKALAASGMPFRELCQEVVRHLRRTCPRYNWVGVYMVEGPVLRLWAWDGPAATQHVEIPLHSGICGWAASTGQIANVPDVRKDPRYLQCFLATRSELVVPIRAGGRVLGEIDIDSDTPAAFGPEDEAFVQAVCDVLAERAAGRVEGGPSTPAPNRPADPGEGVAP